MSVMWVIVLHPYIKCEVGRPSRSEIMADFVHGVKRPDNHFHLLTFKFVFNVIRDTDNLLDNFGALRLFCRDMGNTLVKETT